MDDETGGVADGVGAGGAGCGRGVVGALGQRGERVSGVGKRMVMSDVL